MLSTKDLGRILQRERQGGREGEGEKYSKSMNIPGETEEEAKLQNCTLETWGQCQLPALSVSSPHLSTT